MNWIKITDRIPEVGSKILAFGILEGNLEIRQCKYEEWDYLSIGGSKGSSFSLLSSGCGCCDGVIENITHWMPLPEVPKE